MAGSPGSAKIDLVIRGISSLSADTEPLVVIDGVPTGANQFRNLNAEDIETVSMFEDETESLWISEKDGSSCSMNSPLEKPVTSSLDGAWKAAVVRCAWSCV